MVHSQVFQDALRREDKAFEKFFEDILTKQSGQKVKKGYLCFKRADWCKSFTHPRVWRAVRDIRLEIVKFRPAVKRQASARC